MHCFLNAVVLKICLRIRSSYLYWESDKIGFKKVLPMTDDQLRQQKNRSSQLSEQSPAVSVL